MTDAFSPPMGPAGFGSIRGHDAVIGRLEQAVARGRVHHAYLFSGPDGVGKAFTARALGQALNCREAPGRGCGRCRTCDRIQRGIHPDVVLVETEGKQIKIEQVRWLEDRLNQGAHEAPTLLVIVNEAERLTAGAANALLKNLEEPRAGVHFVLVTAAPHRIPITVRSRCLKIRFSPLSQEVIQEILCTRGGEVDMADDAVRLAEGSVARAIGLADSEQFSIWQQWTGRLADPAALQEEPVPALVQRFLHEVDEPEAVLKLLLPRLRDHLLLASGLDGRGARLTQVDAEGAEAARARATAPLRVQQRLEAVQAGLRDLAFYVNKHLALEQVMMRLLS